VPVVGFDAVIRVPSGSMPTTATELTFALQFSNGRWITLQSVSDEHVRGTIIGIGQSSLQETFGGFAIVRFG
jgi:hypothetical protein